ncbi:alpha/beta hydrolase-fold protein [Microbulbifer sp. ZKSA004]|uniref:alpha/beta hydrolase-fold protein n=1 Tax=Microbulbifer sp. ZKSA004 TaxID=3243389 RepID=UPI00403962E0
MLLKRVKNHASRIRDFTPISDKNWKYLTGKAYEYATFIHDVILPLLARSHRLSDSGHTFIGHSLGGLFGIYMLLTRLSSFDNYILSSLSVWHDRARIFNMKATFSSNHRKVFIGVGAIETPEKSQIRNDMVRGARQPQRKLVIEEG